MQLERLILTCLFCLLFAGGWPVVRGLFEIIFSASKECVSAALVLPFAYA